MAPFNGVPTYSQQVALALVPKFSAALSIVGSAYIVYDVLRSKNTTGRGGDNAGRRVGAAAGDVRRRSAYHRLMIGMSACDLSMSAGIFLSTWPMPAGVPNVWGNVGTIQTCTAQGFFEQFGVSTVMYSGSLSIYYVITITKGRFASRALVHRIEPILHAIPLVFGFGTSFAGLALDLFNYGLWDCWIAPMPLGCNESWRNGGTTDCVRGDNASLYQWIFDLIPKWTSILLVTVNMVLVFSHVRGNERASARWTSNNVGSSPSSEHASVSSSALSSRKKKRPRPRLRRQSSSAAQKIAHQSYLYVGALWITWLPTIITRGSQLATGVTHYWMIMLVAISIPMQGFWTALVYLRPRWLRFRMKQQERKEREAQSGVTSTKRGANFFRDLSVAAVEVVRRGDVVEDEEQRDAAIDDFELEGTDSTGEKPSREVRSERISSVTFCSKVLVLSNAEADRDEEKIDLGGRSEEKWTEDD